MLALCQRKGEIDIYINRKFDLVENKIRRNKSLPIIYP